MKLERRLLMNPLSAVFVAASVVLGAAVVTASTPGGEDDSANREQPAPTWLSGLPIDTPPAEETAVLNSPPPGESEAWKGIADWARQQCTFDGGQPKADPVLILRTTAGEVRRRLAAEVPDGSSLGSNWNNQDILYGVAFAGDFPQRPGPPVPGAEGSADPPPLAHLCVYIGNGATNVADNGSVWLTTQDSVPRTVEALFGGE